MTDCYQTDKFSTVSKIIFALDRPYDTNQAEPDYTVEFYKAPDSPITQRIKRKRLVDVNEQAYDEARNALGESLHNSLIRPSRNDIMTTPTTKRTGVFDFASPTRNIRPLHDIRSGLYSPSPLSPQSRRILQMPRTPTADISTLPVRTMEAPEMQDDFYMNLLDWNSQSILAVVLKKDVFI